MAPAPWFGLKGKAARKTARQSIDALPDGLWTKCPKCNEILFIKELDKNLRVCNKCSYHYRLRAMERIEMTLDNGTFVEMDAGLAPKNPLGFPDYEVSIKKDRIKSGLQDAVVTGTGEIGGTKIAVGVADFTFRGGSMGSVVGEKIVRVIEHAIANGLPVMMFTTSGGARMQEGILSLMQMAKTAAACARLHEAGLPYVVVFADPTTAGVHASYASVGDFIFAEPGALVGFAGARVAQQAGLIHRPDNFQTSEFQLEHGMIDRIVPRKELKATLIKVLEFCVGKDNANAA